MQSERRPQGLEWAQRDLVPESGAYRCLFDSLFGGTGMRLAWSARWTGIVSILHKLLLQKHC